MKLNLYVIGNNPYENSGGDYRTKGNGTWNTRAENVEDALKVIFSGLPFPGEPTGRKFFLDGISLPGLGDKDVIQVWSNEPEIIKQTNTLLKNYKGGGLHSGRGHDFGLHMEIKVTEIGKYVTPARNLLAAPMTPDNENTNTTISPMGASLFKFDDLKHEMQAAIQKERMHIAQKEWEMESLSETMREKMGVMQQQVEVLNTYLHGTRHKTQLARGSKGSGRYKVFQTRVFLSEEIALLGNFADFDFKKLEQLENWLLKSGRIWKFLPFERCILATRIRQERKDYGDPFVNLYNNMENMRNMIWVRDGENVSRVDVEFDFHNAVFPDRGQFDRTLQVCLNFIWQKAFKWSKPKTWQGTVLKPGEYDVMGKLRRKPLEEQEPYYTQRSVRQRFHSLDEWLRSEFYTPLLDKQIKEAVLEYLNEVNRRQMVFAVLLQGIIDNTQLLDVPKGTDLFNWESIDRYFELINDYANALPWGGVSDKIAPYLDGKVSKGDWIVAFVNEYIPPPPERQWAKGTTYKDARPMLFKVADVQEAELDDYVDGEHKKIKRMKPVVNYYPIKRRSRWGEQARRKMPLPLLLKRSEFIRVPMPPSLAVQILDNRNWKSDNKWAVPLMVNYKKIIAAVKKGESGIVLYWDEYKDNE